MDFMFGLPKDSYGNTGIMVFVYRLSKIDHLAAVLEFIDKEGKPALFIDRVFRQNRLPVAIISDRYHHFTGKFWRSISKFKTHHRACPQRVIRKTIVKPSE